MSIIVGGRLARTNIGCLSKACRRDVLSLWQWEENGGAVPIFLLDVHPPGDRGDSRWDVVLRKSIKDAITLRDD